MYKEYGVEKMNNKISNMPRVDQASTGTESVKPGRFQDRRVNVEQGATHVPAEAPSVADKPLVDRKAQVATSQYKAISSLLRENPLLKSKNSSQIKDMLAKIGITPTMTELPPNFTEQLLHTTEFEPAVKVIILDHFQDELALQHSDKTFNETVAKMEKAGEEPKVLESIKTTWHQKAFEQKLHIILIRYMEKNPQSMSQENLQTILKTINYDALSSQDLEDVSSILTALEELLTDESFNEFNADVYKEVFTAFQDTQQIGKPAPQAPPVPLSDLEREEFKKIFSDQDVLKLMAFLQTDKATANQKILHFEKVKVNKEAMATLMASPEFKDLLKTLESKIFTDTQLRTEFDTLIATAQNSQNSKKTIKETKRALKKIEEKMIVNLNKTMNDLKTEMLSGKDLSDTSKEIESKLSALLKVAGDKKIANRDMFMIILKRIGLGIGLCITALFAGAALCAIFIALVKASIIIIPAALTLGIIIGVTMAVFGTLGFSVGAFANVDVREKFKHIMEHIAKFGTNLNVQVTDDALGPLANKIF